jgi:hypothetical protein
MKLLLVSDVHYRLKQYDWLYDAAPDVDVIVIAGDLLDIRSAVPLPAQVAAVSAQISRIGGRTVLLAASGNHDLAERDSADEESAGWLRRIDAPGLHVDGESLLIGTTLFTICRGGTARTAAASWPSGCRPTPRGTGSAGSGSTTRRRTARRCPGTGGASSATRTWPGGSTSSARTSY